jgi:hypothetical protein
MRNSLWTAAIAVALVAAGWQFTPATAEAG